MHRTEGANNSNNLFVEGPPNTTIPADWLNAVQEEIIYAITQAGIELKTAGTDTRTQLWQAMQGIVQGYDYVVYSQATLLALFERTGANVYQIKDGYKSVLVRNIGTGYNMNEILSGGDTELDLHENECTHLEFERGAFWNIASLDFRFNIDNGEFFMKNWHVKGDSTAVAYTHEHLLHVAGERNHFENCTIENVISSTADHRLFYEDPTVRSSSWSGCVVKGCGNTAAGGAWYGFYGNSGLVNCVVEDCTIAANTAAIAYGFAYPYRISNCNVQNCTITGDSTFYSYFTAIDISACEVWSITAVEAVYGYHSCQQITSCQVYTQTSTGNKSVGYYNCTEMVGCRARSISATLAGGADAYAFWVCARFAATTTLNITSVAGVANGYRSCTYGAALATDVAANPGCDWMDSNDAQITNNWSVGDIFT
jgi:hypothetical protein